MKKLKTKINNIHILLGIFCLFLADIFTKYIFTNKYYFEGNLVSISYLTNKGSSFGIFSSYPFYNGFIIFLSLILILSIFIYFKKTEIILLENGLPLYVFVFFLSGILGNLYDRIVYSYVRDFISLKYLFVFNLADFYLIISVFLFFYYEFYKDNPFKN